MQKEWIVEMRRSCLPRMIFLSMGSGRSRSTRSLISAAAFSVKVMATAWSMLSPRVSRASRSARYRSFSARVLPEPADAERWTDLAVSALLSLLLFLVSVVMVFQNIRWAFYNTPLRYSFAAHDLIRAIPALVLVLRRGGEIAREDAFHGSAGFVHAPFEDRLEFPGALRACLGFCRGVVAPRFIIIQDHVAGSRACFAFEVVICKADGCFEGRIRAGQGLLRHDRVDRELEYCLVQVHLRPGIGARLVVHDDEVAVPVHIDTIDLALDRGFGPVGKRHPEASDHLLKVGGLHPLFPEFLLGVEETLRHDGEEQLLLPPVAEGVRLALEGPLREAS